MKIFIYDSSKGFSRFLKLNLSKNHEIHICTSREKLPSFYSHDFDCAFVNFNDKDDLEYLFVIFHEINKIFVSTNLFEIKDMISKCLSINFLNIDTTKTELMKTINHNLELVTKYP